MPGPHPIGRLIGSRISETRKKRGLTQQELADRIGMHVVTLSRVETGATQLGVYALIRIANVLGTKPNHLLCVDDQEAALRVRSERMTFVDRESVGKLEAASHVDDVADLWAAGFAWHLSVRPDMDLVSDDELRELQERLDHKIDELRGFTASWALRRLSAKGRQTDGD